MALELTSTISGKPRIVKDRIVPLDESEVVEIKYMNGCAKIILKEGTITIKEVK